MKKCIFAVLIIVLLMASSSAYASVSGARAVMIQVAAVLINEGYDFDTDASGGGLLREGESAVQRITLYRGNSYAIVASGCEDALDVDVELYNSDGKLLAKDSDSSDSAVLEFSVNVTGTYYIKVKMYDVKNGTGGSAHYVLGVGSK